MNRDEPANLTRGQFESILEYQAREETRWELVSSQLSNIFERLNKLDCSGHVARIEEIDKRGTQALQDVRDRVAALERDSDLTPPPPAVFARPRRPSEEAATKRDLEESQQTVIGEAKRAVLARLKAIEEAQAETARKRWSWRVELAGKLVPILLALAAGSGLTWAARCQPAPASQQQHVRQQHVRQQAAAAPRDAAVPMKGR